MTPAFLCGGGVLPLRRTAPWPTTCPVRASATRPVVTATISRVAVRPVGADSVTVGDGLKFLDRLQRYARDGLVPAGGVATIAKWFESYTTAASRSMHVSEDPVEYTERSFSTLLELIRLQVSNPIDFESFHKSVRTPFDYYKYGLEFATVLVDINNSRVVGEEYVRKAREQVAAGDNVVFLANHQSEGDPFAIDILADWVVGLDRQFCEDLIFMAGDRVREDPVVAPFSIGRNLLTVYSKKHINDIPELRGKKLQHNKRTIAATNALFNQGGHCIWFAPSGGRDRRSPETGLVEVSSFDADAVEMMRITAEKSARPTHFYPMALVNYDMLPPPASVGGAQFGEVRTSSYAPIHMFVDKEIDWSTASERHVIDKLERRRLQAEYVEGIVREGYYAIGGNDS